MEMKKVMLSMMLMVSGMTTMMNCNNGAVATAAAANNGECAQTEYHIFDLLDMYKEAGMNKYTIGESITQSQHAEQAGRLAAISEFGNDDSVIAASLFHDVGHLLGMLNESNPLHQRFKPTLMPGGLGTNDHENLGASILKLFGFPQKTCDLVARHVEAKRYLCCKNETYHLALSPASKGTLALQGGPMNQEEASKFEKDPLFKQILAMRHWDEEAKVENPTFDVPLIDTYFPMIAKLTGRYHLTPEQLKSWNENGFLVIKDIFSLTPGLKDKIVQWVSDLQNLPPTPGKWMHYYEGGKENKMISRTENFLPFHNELRQLLTKGAIHDILFQILGERPVLFKEKVNYKLAGGGGFPAHQDAPAFTTFKQKNHLTVNIAIDKATIENGCLEVARGQHKMGLFPQNPAHGGLTEEAENKLNWESVPLEVGDILIFSSWIPHRSGDNKTNQPRRSLYVTYNGQSDGSFRDQYYIDKRKRFPQECEREQGKDYSEGAKLYNLATPITS